jgi:hypothetical protein
MQMVCMLLRLKVISAMGIVCLPQAISQMEKKLVYAQAKASSLPL